MQDQLLVHLARAVDAHVRQRSGGQQPAQQIERLRLHGAAARGLRLAGRARERLVDPRGHTRERLRVGAEQRVHRRLVLRAECRVAVVAVAAAGHRRVVGDVARGLLEVGGESRSLELLGEDVRHPLAGDVRAAELGHRVVSVADEDPLVQLGRALALAGDVGGDGRQRLRELLQEQPPQRPGIARIAREQRALHGLRQVDEREHRPVQVGHVRRQASPLGSGQIVGRVAHGTATLARCAEGTTRAVRRAAPAPRSSAPAARRAGSNAPRRGRRGRSVICHTNTIARIAAMICRPSETASATVPFRNSSTAPSLRPDR